MLSTAERQELIEKMRQLPDQIEAAVRGLDDAQLDTPYGPGKWTVRQVVHHLADSHMNAIIRMKLVLADSHMNAIVRMKLVLAEDNPTLKPYNQDDWARFDDAAKLPVAPSLSIIRGLHERMVHMLRQAPGSAFARTAHHPEHGTITLDDLVGIYGRHGEKHCGQITGLRSARGW